MNRAEVLAAVKRIYEEHGHPDDWGVQVIYVDSMLAHLDAALAAQEGGRGEAHLHTAACLSGDTHCPAFSLGGDS